MPKRCELSVKALLLALIICSSVFAGKGDIHAAMLATVLFVSTFVLFATTDNALFIAMGACFLAIMLIPSMYLHVFSAVETAVVMMLLGESLMLRLRHIGYHQVYPA